MNNKLTSLGRLYQQISDRDGGGRALKDWWLHDGVDSKVLDRGHL